MPENTNPWKASYENLLHDWTTLGREYDRVNLILTRIREQAVTSRVTGSRLPPARILELLNGGE